MVGAALKYLQDTTVPWQRVVGSGGVISERGDGGEGAAYQADLLRSEGVEVVPAQSDRGRWRVHSFAACAWGTWRFLTRRTYGVVRDCFSSAAAYACTLERSTVCT